MGDCIDKLVASGAFPTDHHIIAADFAFNIDPFNINEGSKTTRYKWGRISNILLNDAYVDQSTSDRTSESCKYVPR